MTKPRYEMQGYGHWGRPNDPKRWQTTLNTDTLDSACSACLDAHRRFPDGTFRVQRVRPDGRRTTIMLRTGVGHATDPDEVAAQQRALAYD